MQADFKKLYRELDKLRKSRSESWRQLGASLSVAPCTFTRLSQGKRVGINNLMKLLPATSVSFQKFFVVD